VQWTIEKKELHELGKRTENDFFFQCQFLSQFMQFFFFFFHEQCGKKEEERNGKKKVHEPEKKRKNFIGHLNNAMNGENTQIF
jgi:hypothetical protein